MASTLNLMQSVLWTGPYIGYQSLVIGGMEPAMTNANLVKQTILGAPFRWPWNRSETEAINVTKGTQDYVQALPDFGFIEKAWLTIGTEIKEITVQNGLSRDSSGGRPQFISTQTDDGLGNITFRLLSSPGQDGSLNILYQRKSALMSSLASRWNPIPDELSYIANFGFLALGMVVTDDARFPIFNDRFIAHLLGLQDGLDETQRNLFLNTWLGVTKQVQRAAMMPQQGMQSRGR
jgi:hypothetical protein